MLRRPLETSRLDFHAVVAKRPPRMLRRRFALPFLLLLAAARHRRGRFTRSSRAVIAASCRSTARARSRSAASMSTSAAPTRRARAMPAGGSRNAQGFKALWAKMHNAPIDQAPNLPDGDARPDRQLDQRRARTDRAQPLHRRPRRAVRSRPGRRLPRRRRRRGRAFGRRCC